VYKLDSSGLQEEPVIAIVGVGGTGAFVAEGVCRLLGRRKATLVLVDYDRVEPHNLRRQAFYEADIDQFKAKVVAERLARQFGREVTYSVHPYSPEAHTSIFRYNYRKWPANGLVIGCVDNPEARKVLSKAIEGQWWIDAGNGEQSGQVLIGNIEDSEALRGSFVTDAGVCAMLPLPSTQVPELLAPAAPAPVTLDCAEAVESGDQSPTINQSMASLTVEFVSRLVSGTLPWMGAYLDMELGTMRTVMAEPEAVARVTGRTKKFLTDKNGRPAQSGQQGRCGCGRYHW
jgi:PRTRC genetic system ThiF family protein